MAEHELDRAPGSFGPRRRRDARQAWLSIRRLSAWRRSNARSSTGIVELRGCRMQESNRARAQHVHDLRDVAVGEDQRAVAVERQALVDQPRDTVAALIGMLVEEREHAARTRRRGEPPADEGAAPDMARDQPFRAQLPHRPLDEMLADAVLRHQPAHGRHARARPRARDAARSLATTSSRVRGAAPAEARSRSPVMTAQCIRPIWRGSHSGRPARSTGSATPPAAPSRRTRSRR